MLQSGSDYVNETIFTFVSNRKTKISLRRYSVKQISLKMKSELTERPWLRLGIRAKSRYKRAGISVWRSFADDGGRNEAPPGPLRVGRYSPFFREQAHRCSGYRNRQSDTDRQPRGGVAGG